MPSPVRTPCRALVVVTAIAVSLLATAGVALAADSQPEVTSPTEQTLLAHLTPKQADLRDGFGVLLQPAGNQVRDQATLDLCKGPFPSERLRTGRLQTIVLPVGQRSTDAQLFSIEAVAYGNAQDARQAMREVRQAAKTCPSSYVEPSTPGATAVKWKFLPAPDGNWPKVAGVDRAAFDVQLSTRDGHDVQERLVYQQRGRFLVALYGSPDDISKAIVPSFGNEAEYVEVLAKRLATVATAKQPRT